MHARSVVKTKSPLCRSYGTQTRFEAIFHYGPIGFHNTIERRVAPFARCRLNTEGTQRAFVRRSDALHRGARTRVDCLAFELHTVEVHRIECVRQQQIFALGVHVRTPMRTRDERPADFELFVFRLQIGITCRPYDGAARFIDDCECVVFCTIACVVPPPFDIRTARKGIITEGELPQRLIVAAGNEIRDMAAVDGFEADARGLEGERMTDHASFDHMGSIGTPVTLSLSKG